MNKKIIIMGLMILSLIGIVSAITVGQILTQQQVDNADIKIIDLNPSWEVKDNGNLRIADCRTDADVCTAYVNVGTTITQKQNCTFEEGDLEEVCSEIYYEVINKTIAIPFRTTKYYDIAQDSSRQEAFDQLMTDLRPRAISKLKEEVARIESFKTQEIMTKQTEMLNIVDGNSVTNINE